MDEKELYIKYYNDKVFHIEGKDYTDGGNAAVLIDDDHYCDGQDIGGIMTLLVTEDEKYVKVRIKADEFRYELMSFDDAVDFFYRLIKEDEEEFSKDEARETILEAVHGLKNKEHISSEHDSDHLESKQSNENDSLIGQVSDWHKMRMEELEREREENRRFKLYTKFQSLQNDLICRVTGWSTYPSTKHYFEDVDYEMIKQILEKMLSYLVKESKVKSTSKYNNYDVFCERIIPTIINIAPVIGDKKILDDLIKYKHKYNIDRVNEKEVEDAISKIEIFKDIFDSIEPNTEYKRADFVRAMKKKYPTLFVEEQGWIYNGTLLCDFWEAQKKISYKKAKNRIYFLKL